VELVIMSADLDAGNKSPGMRQLAEMAEEVVNRESMDGSRAMAEAADLLANNTGTIDPLSSSLNMSASSTTIANALSSSAELGGKAVTISLPTQTPMKSPTHVMAQSTPMTEGGIRERMLAQAEAAIDAGISKSVTIDETENTAQSPSSSAFVDNSSAAGAGGMPVLKDAGASGHKLESRMKTSPVHDKSSLVKSASPARSPAAGARQQQQQKAPEVSDKERAKAKYLLSRAYNRKSEDSPADRGSDNDRYSSYSGNSGGSYGSNRSVRASESDIAKRLRASQQRLRESQEDSRDNGRRGGRSSRDKSLEAVFSGLSEQQQALFLSMKSTAQAKGGNSGRRGASPDSKSVASSYDDGRSSVRSSQSSRRTAGSSSSKSSSKRPSSASSSSMRRSAADIHKITDRLIQPVHVEPSAEEKSLDPMLKYLLIDEAKQCRTKPFKAKKWAGSNRADDDEAKSNFIERMESQEQHRRDDMQHRREAEDYNALLTRKECPSCGLKQKYDEVKDKKTKCPNCDVEYKPKLTWGQVGKRFLTRTSEEQAQSQAKKEELVKKIEELEQPVLQKFDPKLGRVVTVAAPKNKKKWTDNTKVEFFDRMDEHKATALKNLQKIEDESFGMQCTFMPETGAKRDEEDEENTGIHAFLRRLDEEMEEKKEKSPHLFSDKFEPDPALDGKPSWKPT
jgi:hypothetical protein